MPANTDNSEIRIICINRNVIEALLAITHIFRTVGRNLQDASIRDLSYRSANEYEDFLEEIWSNGFTLEGLEEHLNG